MMRKQRSASELGFDRYDKGRLGNALKKVTEKRIFLRLKAVFLVAQGMNIQAVAKLFERSFQMVYQWVNRYLKVHQAAALFDTPRAGRPKAAPCITDERILEELNRNPLHFGYRTNVWTVVLLAKQLSHRYQCDIRPRTLYRRMKQMGLRCKCPRYVYSEKDPNRAQGKRGDRPKAKRDATFSGSTL